MKSSESGENEYSFLIADDHPAIRMVLKQLIARMQINCTIDEVATVEDVHEHIRTKEYDIAILDVHLEDGVTITELETIRKKQPKINILFFSICPEDIYAQRLIKLGANGFVNKKATEQEIMEAINKVLKGKRYLSPDFLYALLLNPDSDGKVDSNPFLQLSPREFEVLTLILYGKSNKEISELINMGPSTVSTHRVRILEKLNVKSDVDLTRLADVYGIVSQ